MLKPILEFLFGTTSNVDRAVGKIIAVLFIFVIVINLITTDTQFEDPELITPTHYYQTPRPDPNREIHHFDYQRGVYVYRDEIDYGKREPSKTVRDQPRRIRDATRREREALDDLREIYQEKAKREFEYILDEHEIDW